MKHSLTYEAVNDFYKKFEYKHLMNPYYKDGDNLNRERCLKDGLGFVVDDMITILARKGEFHTCPACGGDVIYTGADKMRSDDVYEAQKVCWMCDTAYTIEFVLSEASIEG